MSTKINEQIKSPTARVIGPDGENLGVLATSAALQIARNKGLDLVEVAGNAVPPVCKIQDYNKYLYDQNSKAKKTRVKKSELKEFIFGPHIGEGDLAIRIRRGKEFLLDGNLVKYTVKFVGRQIMYPSIGETKLKIVESELAEVAKVESAIRLSEKFMSITFVAKKTK